MRVGEAVKCNLFEKKGMITGIYDVSSSADVKNEPLNIVKLVWEDGKEEVVNVSEHPQRLKKLSDVESVKAQLDAFGADLADIDIH